MMDSLSLKGKWNQLKGKAKEEWSELTDDDLLYVEGKENELFGKIQERTGKTMDEISTWFKDQLDKLD